VIGCPHVSLEYGSISETQVDREGSGYLVSAVRGAGAHIRPLTKGALSTPRPIDKLKPATDTSKLVRAPKLNPTRSLSGLVQTLGAQLGTQWTEANIDSSQLRYVSSALGFIQVFLRIKSSVAGSSYIYDHAGGALIYEEVGGKVTDILGKKFDFGAGRKLSRNYGLVAAPADIHEQVIHALTDILSKDPEYGPILQQARETLL